MTQIIFCHGFSFSKAYWDNLIPHLTGITIHHMDLGYYEDPHIPNLDNLESVIGIGHSIGLIKLMQLPLKFRALIGLNAFINFCGQEKHLHDRRSLELNLFEKMIQIAPHKTLASFHKRCGVPWPSKIQNLDRLVEDMGYLRKSLNPPDNLTVIAAQDDPVCSPEIVYDNFAKNQVFMLESGGHGLGFHQTKIISEIIKKECADDLDTTGRPTGI